MTRPRPTLIDTSAFVDALRKDGDPGVRASVAAALGDGRAAWCEMVALELWNGARGTAELAWLRKLSADIETLPLDDAVWSAAHDLARSCRKAGVTVPATDILIAACARQHGADLLHRDSDFDAIAAIEARRAPRED